MEKKVPKLRFKEFEEVWEKTTLGEVALFYKGKGISKADVILNGKTPCIRYGELYTKYQETIDIVYSATDINPSDLCLSESNDVIIPASGETAIDISTASCVLSPGVALGGDLNIIRSINNGIFLSYYLNSKKKQDIANLAQGISVIHLYANQLKTLELYLPVISEQSKIASFLSAVDRRIEALEKQMELQERYKKGMMQKLFSQEIRFKDENGEEFPEWEEMKLGEIADVKSGLSNDQNSKTIGHKVTRIETISEGTVNLNKVGYVDTSDDIEEYKLCVGDILFSNINSVSHIGKTAIILKDFSLYHGMNLLCIKNKGYSDSIFIYYLLNTAVMRSYFMTICNKAVNQASINQSELLKTKIFIPTLPEQQKIAKFLTSFDIKIKSNKNQIKTSNKWKNGLLQQLFV